MWLWENGLWDKNQSISKQQRAKQQQQTKKSNSFNDNLQLAV